MNTNIANLVTSFFSLYRFPSGRRLYAMLELQRRATALGLTQVVEHAARAVAHDRYALEREGRYIPLRSAQYGPDAIALDQQVDRKLAALDGFLDSQLRMFEEGSERAQAAAYLRDRFFPRGIAAMVRQSFIQEHMEVDALLGRREQPAVAAAIEALPGLAHMLDELKASNDQYGAAISDDDDRPTTDELRMLQAHGQRLMAEVIGLVVGHFGSTAPDDYDSLQHVLEPILEQQEVMGALHRRRRRIVDVDPETGDELPEGGEVGEQPGEGELPGEDDELPGENDELPGEGDELPDESAA
ncbi:hypothetical protein [Haliangium sp.]|uniref:hypothetical protein n=1 Tax=Haliangium sp. TaxID=2663208 RepID=UPI003D126FB2